MGAEEAACDQQHLPARPLLHPAALLSSSPICSFLSLCRQSTHRAPEGLVKCFREPERTTLWLSEDRLGTTQWLTAQEWLTPVWAPPGRALGTGARLTSTHSRPAGGTDGAALWPQEETRLFNQMRERLHNVLCSTFPGTLLPSRIPTLSTSIWLQLLCDYWETFARLNQEKKPTNVRYTKDIRSGWFQQNNRRKYIKSHQVLFYEQSCVDSMNNNMRNSAKRVINLL